MSAWLTGLLLVGFLATEVVVTAASDHVAQALVRPALGDAVYAGPPIPQPDEKDYSGYTDADMLRLAAGYDAKTQPQGDARK